MQELIKALIKAQQEFQPIEKDRVNPHYKSKYATLDSVLKAVTPGLHNNGLTVIQTTDMMGEKFVLVTRLLHESGGELISNYILPDISDPQKLGSAITYARRYSLCALLNVTADEDDDGNTATPSTPAKFAAKSPATPAPVRGVITKPQRDQLIAIMEQHGVSREEATKVFREFGYAKSQDILASDFVAICDAIKVLHSEVQFSA